MDLITYGGIALGIGIVCSLGYRIARKRRTAGSGEGKHVMNKITDFYQAQNASRDRFEI